MGNQVQFSERGHSSFQLDPILSDFDLLVIHLDADLVTKRYSDISAVKEQIAQNRDWPSIPVDNPCPPVETDALLTKACIKSWAGVSSIGVKTVLCVPSKTIESWLTAAVFANNHAILNNLECNFRVAEQMANLPKRERLRKNRREFEGYKSTVTSAWQAVREKCSQAERFSQDVEAFVRSLP